MSQTEKTYPGDFIEWLADPNYCLANVTLKAATTQTIKVGSLLRDNTGYILVVSGQEANCSAIALEAVSATGGEQILALVRGPVVINSTPIESAKETSVTIATALNSTNFVPKIVHRANPTTSVQTT